MTVASTIGQINSGQLKLLGYTNDSSPPGCPEGPDPERGRRVGHGAGAELVGDFAPKGTPAPIVNAMNAAIQEHSRSRALSSC